MRDRNVRRLITTLGLIGALAAACAPAAPSPATAPTAAPAAPTSAPAKPAEKAAEAAPARPAAEAKPAQPEAKPAAKPPTTAAEVLVYNGPDRQQILEEGARKEGKLLWYTSLIIQERARPLADAFREKYPFINVDIVRLDTNALVSRAFEEYRAGKYDLDLVEASYPGMVAMKDAQMLARFSSPMLDGIPKEAIDPDGLFFADRENPLVLVHNNKLVPDAEAPKTFDDLLDPKWKGKLAIQDTSQDIQYTGAMLHVKGEDFLRKLAQQDVTVYSGSARGVVDLVAAGEVPMTFPASVSHGQLLQKQGAPIGWQALEPVPTAAGYVALMAKTSHPYSIALMADFLASDAGQEVMVKTEMGAVRKGTKNPYPDFKKVYIDFLVPASEYAKEYKRWTDLHSTLFTRRST